MRLIRFDKMLRVGQFRLAMRNMYQTTRQLAAWAGKKEAIRPREHRAVGALAHKVGMMNIWDGDGVRHPVTVLCIDRCHVLQVKPPQMNEKRHRWGVQVGAFPRRPYKTKKPMRYHCAAAGVEPKRQLAEFHVDEKHVLPVGTEIRANHFLPGMFVDVTGTTIGKGTQGVMKRWGFKGGPASHGCSKAHRKAGSIGQSTQPGRVFKGKKMAGRMGNKKKTIQNLRVMRIDEERNLVFVRGAIPGNSGRPVRVRAAMWREQHNAQDATVLAAEVKDVGLKDVALDEFDSMGKNDAVEVSLR